ncbi:MAG: biotin--[acetyl-CoA-carboxylase] ligase, partial [Alphaproteobacteria bacterium]|nr:biotin--[acetyl-CoA-carboxylase] ligase [Alphaproteobacteria bacterium]
MQSANLPKPYHLYQFAEVASTNDEARRLAQEGVPMPAWILADRQTAGRGRFKRTWVSSQGNFMAS